MKPSIKNSGILFLLFLAIVFGFKTQASNQSSYWKNYFSSEEQKAVQKNAEKYTIKEIESKSEKWKGVIRSYNIKNGSISDEDIKENGIGTDKISGLGDYIDGKISGSSTPQDFSADKLTGSYAALNGSQITDINPANITGSGNLNIGEGDLFVDTISGNVGIGTTSPSTPLDINNSAFMQIQTTRPDSTGTSVWQQNLFSSSSFGPTFAGQMARGTISSPQALISGTHFLTLAGNGYDGGSYRRGAQIYFDASENWSGSGSGSDMVFFTTPNGSTSATAKMIIKDNGSVGIGTITPGQKMDVTGNINISDGSSYMYNGVNLAYANTTLGNYFFGNAGNLTMTGGNNTASGNYSLGVNTTGYANTASGVQSLFSNTTGYENTALGLVTLYSNTSGFKNVAIGKYALNANTIANGNTAVGWHSMYSNTIGNTNSALGRETLAKNVEGISNVAVGWRSLYFNTVGSYNTAVGTSALDYSVGNNNTALGYYAGNRITSGSNNITLGYRAGDIISTGANNIVIGYDIDLPAVSSSNMLNVGNLIYGIGIDGTGTTLSSGNVGIGTSDPKTKLEVDGIIKTKERSIATCDVDAKGGIYFDSDDNHFYGCNGTAWVQLDN